MIELMFNKFCLSQNWHYWSSQFLSSVVLLFTAVSNLLFQDKIKNAMPTAIVPIIITISVLKFFCCSIRSPTLFASLCGELVKSVQRCFPSINTGWYDIVVISPSKLICSVLALSCNERPKIALYCSFISDGIND